jgi:hypothetical protein
MNTTDHPPPPTMTDPPLSPETDGRPDRDSTPSTPRWVKVSGIIAIVAVVLIAVMLLAGGGQHGPGRHLAPAGDHMPPAGGHAPR